MTFDYLGQFESSPRETPQATFREIPVKVHIRRPDRDNWTYLGRAVVAFEPNGPRSSSRVGESSLPFASCGGEFREFIDYSTVVRAAATHKVMCIFDNVSGSVLGMTRGS
jgi:hypothetical protein